MLEGHLAMWAVRQSPYHNPEGLSLVLRQFRQNGRYSFDENEMGYLNEPQLKQFLIDRLMPIPEFLQWNERKNGNQSPFGFVSRYDKPEPDNDFIDLNALIMNTARSVIQECKRDS